MGAFRERAIANALDATFEHVSFLQEAIGQLRDQVDAAERCIAGYLCDLNEANELSLNLQRQIAAIDQEWSEKCDRLENAVAAAREQHEIEMRAMKLESDHVANENSLLIQDAAMLKTILDKHATLRLAEKYDAELELELRKRGAPLMRQRQQAEDAVN